MKLPSVKNLFLRISETFLRFPLPVFVAFIGTLAALVLATESKSTEGAYIFINLLHTCMLGLSLTIAATLFAEQKQLSKSYRFGIDILLLLLLVAYYFYLPVEPSKIYYIRAVLLFIAFHLLVSFVPFIRKDSTIDFWQFNKNIFLRFLTSGLYSGVLFVGLFLALQAISNLFNIPIKEFRYLQLWIVMAGIFNTIFFLAGVPKEYNSTESLDEYPKGLKIFTQYVLIPLVTIYLIILYAYMLKIMIQWELPKGWVSYLVLGFSTAGIFSLLLVYPIQDTTNDKWIRVYSKWFYRALFPLIVLLFVAIEKRIITYGITENRYFIILLSFWLTGITIYMLATRLKKIKMIPVSLFFIATLSSFGPWGAFSVSLRSQLNRFEQEMIKLDMLKNGKVEKTEKKISFEDEKLISTTLDYIIEMHGIKNLQPYFTQILDTLNKNQRHVYAASQKIMNLMGLTYVDKWSVKTTPKELYSYRTTFVQSRCVPVNGFDYLIEYNKSYPSSQDHGTDVQFTGPDSLKIIYNSETNSLKFDFLNQPELSYPLDSLFNKLQSKYLQDEYSALPADMQILLENDKTKLQINFSSFNLTRDSTKVYTTAVTADILVKMKK